MNVKDVVDFLDLVKNPEKYEALANELQARQDALDARIAAVGLIGDIEGLKQKAEKLVSVANKKAEKIEADANDAFEKRQAAYDDLFAKLKEQELAVAKKAQDADSKLAIVNELVSATANKQSSITQRERAVSLLESQVADLKAEYEEKVAKLRSVMA